MRARLLSAHRWAARTELEPISGPVVADVVVWHLRCQDAEPRPAPARGCTAIAISDGDLVPLDNCEGPASSAPPSPASRPTYLARCPRSRSARRAPVRDTKASSTARQEWGGGAHRIACVSLEVDAEVPPNLSVTRDRSARARIWPARITAWGRPGRLSSGRPLFRRSDLSDARPRLFQ